MNYKASDIDGSWAVNALHETIKAFNDQSREQTAQMLTLTKVMAWLTGVMLLGLLVQIYLALWPPTLAPDKTTVGAIAPAATTGKTNSDATRAAPKVDSPSMSPTAAGSSGSK